MVRVWGTRLTSGSPPKSCSACPPSQKGAYESHQPKNTAPVMSSAKIGVRNNELMEEDTANQTARMGRDVTQNRRPQRTVVPAEASPRAMQMAQMTACIASATAAHVAHRPKNLPTMIDGRRARTVQ